jgi:hypothetical protein
MAARCLPRRCRARPARAPLPLVVGASRSTLASPSSGGFVQAAVDAYARTGHRPAWLSDELLAVLEARGRLVGLVYLLHFDRPIGDTSNPRGFASHYTGKPASSGLLKVGPGVGGGEFAELGLVRSLWLLLVEELDQGDPVQVVVVVAAHDVVLDIAVGAVEGAGALVGHGRVDLDAAGPAGPGEALGLGHQLRGNPTAQPRGVDSKPMQLGEPVPLVNLHRCEADHLLTGQGDQHLAVGVGSQTLGGGELSGDVALLPAMAGEHGADGRDVLGVKSTTRMPGYRSGSSSAQ